MLLLMLSACGAEDNEPPANQPADASPGLVPECLSLPGGASKLYAGGVSGLVGRAGQAYIVADDHLVSVPLAGGTPVEIFSASDLYGLALLGGDAYFTIGGSLAFVSLSGGPSTPIPFSPAPSLHHSVVATDAESIYFGQVMWNVSKLTPPSWEVVQLPISGKLLPESIAAYGDYIYVLAGDGWSGTLQRLPKGGGPAELLQSGLGLVSSLAVDDSGVYFIEDPANFVGIGRVVRTDLDGGSSVTLVDGHATSLAVAYGRLYYSNGGAILSVPTEGGDPESLVVANGAGMLEVVGGDLIWVAPAVKTLSDTTVPIVQTACLPTG